MKGKIILISVIVALLGGAFYWLQWRPTQIRKECSIFESELIKNGKIQGSGYIPIGLR